MVFSSPLFLLYFLPIVLILYYLLNPRLRNYVLLVASLLFYAFGEPKFIFIMIIMVMLDYLLGLRVSYCKTMGKSTKSTIVFTVIVNVSILFVFKYLDFVISNLNIVLDTDIPLYNVALPIGISFFTFQAMSYVFDIDRGVAEAKRNPIDVLLYVCLFPQLIAGPIVRYEDIASEISDRKETLSDFSRGVTRFIIGLSKKVIIADTLGITVDYIFSLPSNSLSFVLAWIGALGYSLQLYFDFSGYSDMAIGLGLMFGFHFLENFNYPYISKTISEFWRRWHISMGSWFRDYIYFPLGGSRTGSKAKNMRNLIVVWLLTGIWHGANWTFIVWGIWNLLWIVFEKVTDLENIRGGMKAVGYHFASIVIIILGWVLFRSDSIKNAITYWTVMFGAHGLSFSGNDILIIKDIGIFILIAVICSMPVTQRFFVNGKYKTVKIVGSVALLLVSVSFMITASSNPFLYFNF